MGICSLPLIFARKYDIMKSSDERQGGSIFGQKFQFNAVGKKVEYLWMYYKIWLIILAVVIDVIYLGCTMLQGQTYDSSSECSGHRGRFAEGRRIEQRFL